MNTKHRARWETQLAAGMVCRRIDHQMTSFEESSVESLLVRMRAARVQRDWTNTDRRRGPGRLLTVVEKDIAAGVDRILAYLPMADEQEQRAAFEFPSHVVVRGELMYAVEKLAADCETVEESRFVPPEQAAVFLLEVADLGLSEDLLRRGGLHELLAYFREHPVARPALTQV